MGRKYGWAWKHIPLYVAGVIASAVFACASTNALVTSGASSEASVTSSASSDASVAGSAFSDASGTGQEIVSYLQRVQPLIRQGDYEGAIKESQEALSVSPKSPPGDEALFYMGLISVHYGNPKKDYQKALSFFRRVTKEFPLSPRAEESKIWIGVLEAIEKAKQVDIQIEEKKKELTK